MKHSEGFVRIVNDARGRIHEVTITDVKERMDRGEKFLLIDVRKIMNGTRASARGGPSGQGIIERTSTKLLRVQTRKSFFTVAVDTVPLWQRIICRKWATAT